jgi:membrane protein insertase, yidC/oxa1 family
LFETIVVNPIFNALMLIYSAVPGGDFGVALIIFTIIVRLLMYPLVKNQLHQTKAMRKLQPELAKIKENAQGNKQIEALQQMELYKRYGIKPLRSILILIIQLPIFIALFQVIRVITLHRDQVAQHIYEPFKHIDAIKAVIEHPENFNHTMLGFIDLTKTTFSNGSVDLVLLALAVISALTQYVMSRQTMPADSKGKKLRDLMAEAADGKQADPSEMSSAMTRGMMKFMPIMMFMIMVGLPGALALYYTISNLSAVAQQHYLLKKDVGELDEIADEAIKTKKSSTKGAKNQRKKTGAERAKQAREGHVTRIKAKG